MCCIEVDVPNEITIKGVNLVIPLKDAAMFLSVVVTLNHVAVLEIMCLNLNFSQ